MSGELGPPLNMKGAIAKGSRLVCVFVAGVGGGRVWKRQSGRRAEEAATNNVVPPLRDTAADAADLDEVHGNSTDKAPHVARTAL